MIASIDVYLSMDGTDVPVGRAHTSLRRGEVSTSFTYDGDYLERKDAIAIDAALPLRSTGGHVDGLPGAMRDSSPDRWGRHLIARRHLEGGAGASPLRALDEVDYLLGVHDLTRQGALRFRPSGSDVWSSPQEGVPPIVNLPGLIAASNDVARGSSGRDEVKTLLDAGSGSLGGARPKASVLDGGRLLLAKFSHPGDEWDAMGWEKTTLDLAAQAGIDVPRSRLVRLGNENAALVLERFDRMGSRVDGGRIAYISGMTLLGAHDGEPHDYLELAEALAGCVKDAPRQLAELFRRIVFSIAVHNTDDHLRNVGFLAEKGRWRLSPCFDVNPNPYQTEPRVTAVFGETGAKDAQALRAILDIFGLSPAAARSMVKEVVVAVGGWERAARKNACPESQIVQFRPVFEMGCRRLERAFTR